MLVAAVQTLETATKNAGSLLNLRLIRWPRSLVLHRSYILCRRSSRRKPTHLPVLVLGDGSESLSCVLEAFAHLLGLPSPPVPRTPAATHCGHRHPAACPPNINSNFRFKATAPFGLWRLHIHINEGNGVDLSFDLLAGQGRPAATMRRVR